MKYGKNITITISEDEVIDADFLQRVLDGEIVKDVPYFDMWDSSELKNMIKYMNNNNYVIAPGNYTINQAWGFKDGKLLVNKIENGKIVTEKRVVFEFMEKND